MEYHMKFFYSPKRLIELIKNSKKYASSPTAEKIDRAWFSSEKGEASYEKANTPAKRMKLFYDFFKCIDEELIIKRRNQGQWINTSKPSPKDKRETSAAYKMAYLHAVGMVDTCFYFSSYPNIFDPSKNPFVQYYLNNGSFDAKQLISILRNDNNKDFSNYRNLTYCQNGQPSEIYKLERLIITLAGADSEANLVPPYAPKGGE